VGSEPGSHLHSTIDTVHFVSIDEMLECLINVMETV
jgi:hypothetical protein